MTRRTGERIAVAAVLLSIALFVLIAMNVATGQPLARLDLELAQWLYGHAFPLATHVLLVITYAHGPLAICIYTAGLGWLVVNRREWGWLIAISLAVPVGLAINTVLKEVFQRARPVWEHPILSLASHSFPSGHTAGAVLFYGVAAAYAMSRLQTRRARTACVLLWLLMVVLVGFSRMYLGVHYLGDVLGAAAWSFAWLALSLWLADRIGAARMGSGLTCRSR